MKLECKIKRVGGTDVDLPPNTIQFRPIDPTRADSPHVCDVTSEQAQRLILADPRVYVLFDEAAAAAAPKLAPPSPPPPKPVPQQPVALYGSSTLPSHIDIGGGATLPLGDIVREAFKLSSLSADEWNNLDEAVRDARLQAVIDAVRGTKTSASTDSEPAAVASTPAADTTASTAGGQAEEKGDDKTAGDANGDGTLSVRELKAAIAEGKLTHEQLRELMAKEEEAQEPRQSFIAEIVKALK